MPPGHLILVVALAATVSSCNGGQRGSRTGRLPLATQAPSGPLVATSGSGRSCTLPPGRSATNTPSSFAFSLQLPPGAVLTSGASSGLEGHAPGTIDAVTAEIRVAISRAGYVETSYENEGRATKLVFFTGTDTVDATISINSCDHARSLFSLHPR